MDNARKNYIKNLGIWYAGQGGLFCPYRESSSAFEACKNSKIFSYEKITDQDFADFDFGFVEFQDTRNAMAKVKNTAQAEISAFINQKLEGKSSKAKNLPEFLKELEEKGEKNA